MLFTYAGASSAAAENLLFFLLFGFDPASAAVDYVVLIVDGQDGPPPLPKDVDARLTAGVAAGMGGGTITPCVVFLSTELTSGAMVVPSS